MHSNASQFWGIPLSRGGGAPRQSIAMSSPLFCGCICAYDGPIKAIDPLPKGLDVHTNGSNLDCVVATTSMSLLFLHPRCDSPLFGVFHQKMEMPQTPKEFCILSNSVPLHVDHLDMRCMTLSCHPSWGCSCNQVF